MALRELIIQLTTRANTRDLDRLKSGLDSVTSRVSDLDAGLSGVGSKAGEAARVSGAALQQLAGIAGTAGAEMGAALGEAFQPLSERASVAVRIVGEKLATVSAQVNARLADPVRRSAESFRPLAERATAAAGAVSAAAGRISASIQTSIVGPLRAAQSTAGSVGQGIARGFAPVLRAADRVSATVRPMLDPLSRAASQTRGVISTWAQQVTAIASRAAEDIHRKIGAAAQSATNSVSGMSRKLKAQAGPKTDGGESKGPGLITAGVAGAVGGLAVGAIVKGTQALASYGAQALQTASEIKQLSASTGASSDAVQVWNAIAKNSGAGPDAVKGSFKGLAAAVDGANKGNKEFVAVFAQLGIATQDAEGKTRPLGTLLREVGGALGEIEDPAQKAVLTQKLLSEAGLQLAPAFAGGAAGVDALVGKFKTLGVTMSAETVEKMAAVNQKVKDMQAGFAMIGPQVMVAFAPLVDTIVSTVLPLLPMITEQIVPIVDVIASGLGPVIKSVLPLFAQILQELLPVIGSLVPVIVEVAAVLASALGPVIQGLLPVFAQIIKAILPIVPTLLNALLPAFMALLPAVLAITAALMPLIEQLMPILTKMIADLAPILTVIAELIAARLVFAITIWSSWLSVIISGLGVLGSTLTIAINALKLLWAVFTGNGEAMSAASAALDTAFADWWTSITGFGDKILGYFTAIWDGVKAGLSGALAAVGIGDGASVSVEAVSSGAARTAAANAPTASVNATTNQSTTLTDQRNISISVSGAPTPAAVASQVSSSLDQVFTSDRGRTMSAVAG